MLKPLDYCHVTSRKKAKSDGVEVGDLVLISAMKAFPDSYEDPYMQRVFALCIKVDQDGTHHMPRKDNDDKVYVIDPRSLTIVSEEVGKYLASKYEEFLNGQPQS